MTFKLFGRIYFVLLLFVYLGVLLTSQVGDSNDILDIMGWVLAAGVELGVAGLFCYGLAWCYIRTGRRWVLIITCIIAFIVGSIYAGQIASLMLSGNFITALAMMNADSVAFVRSIPLFFLFLCFLIFYSLFMLSIIYERRKILSGLEQNSPCLGREQYRIALGGAVVAFGFLVAVQHPNMALAVGTGEAPIVGLVSVLGQVKTLSYNQGYQAGELPNAFSCWRGGSMPSDPEYPFFLRHAEGGSVPFHRTDFSQKPNVIVFFTEGLSARMIGSYGASFPGLTPNIDLFAERSMRVDNYYNHTAATFRGLIGQLSSAMVYKGGGDVGGWDNGGLDTLTRTRRMTLPRILRNIQYQSYFFSPHVEDKPFTTMIRSLGFDRVETYESINHELLSNHGEMRVDALNDSSLIKGLIAFLQNREFGENKIPFFMGLYNIGTHAFIDVNESDPHYGDGKNKMLNKVHAWDDALGEFFKYFFASSYAKDTIIILTSDHATYPSQEDYRAVAGEDLKPYFVDRIPLFIYDPTHELPKTWDAKARTSLDLAPTLLQLLDISHESNTFLGSSLFSRRTMPVSVAMIPPAKFAITPEGVFTPDVTPAKYQQSFECVEQLVQRYYQAEADNKLVPPGMY